MLAIDSSVTPYCSRVISPPRLRLFSIAIRPMSAVHCKRLNRLSQVCHHGRNPGTLPLLDPSPYSYRDGQLPIAPIGISRRSCTPRIRRDARGEFGRKRVLTPRLNRLILWSIALSSESKVAPQLQN